jgi:6-phosphogluconolactonase
MTLTAAGAGILVAGAQGVELIAPSSSPDAAARVLSSASIPHSSFLLAGTRPGLVHVLSAGETGGQLTTLAIAAENVSMRSQVPIPGAEPCHAVFVGEGSHLAIANYVSGDVALFALDDDGLPQPEAVVIALPPGSGPDADRQEAPHPHFLAARAGLPVTVEGLGTGLEALIVDLGADRVCRLVREDGKWGIDTAVALPEGAGPRHAVVVGSRLVVSDELSGAVSVIDLSAPQTVQTVAATRMPGADPAYPGDIVALGDAAVAVAIRSRNTVAILDIDHDSGAATYRTEVSAGRWPQQVGWDGTQVLALARDSGELVRIDPETGGAEVILTSLDAPMWAIDVPAEGLAG